MSSPIDDLLAPALAARALLWANHVLAAHPLAPGRLQPHRGKRLAVEVVRWPLPVLAPPPMRVRITPAGLLEADEGSVGDAAPADLRIVVDLGEPLRVAEKLAASELPPVSLEGDAALAAEASWLLANVRWDIAADIEKLFGPVVAAEAQRAGRRAAAAARAAFEGVRGLGERMRAR